jgi:PleD family two-component response regulator
MDEQVLYKVLIVDDIPANIHILAEALGEEYDVRVATDGLKALELAADLDKPDIILLDIMMPGMDGLEVCRRLRDNPECREIPVVFVTAMTERDVEIQGLELGAVDYISKPFVPTIVRLRVANQLELKKQRDLLAFQKQQLEATLAKVKLLEGILPVCMYCKKIRRDDDAWQQIEAYITEHSEALFSHGLCPECAAEALRSLEEAG